MGRWGLCRWEEGARTPTPPPPLPSQSTWDIQVIPVSLTVSVLLPICVLLGVLQAQLVADLERLPHRPDNAHGLALRQGRRGEEERNLSWAAPAR